MWSKVKWRFSGGSMVKNPPANVGDTDSVPRSERSPGEGNNNPLQCSCLEKSMDRPRGHKESDTTERLTHKRASYSLKCKGAIQTQICKMPRLRPLPPCSTS